MPRAKFTQYPESPYHISARCLNREWFGLPICDVWKIMTDHLWWMHHGYDLKIHSFVLMSNHFHLLASAPKCNLSEAMQYFMAETGRDIRKPLGRINRTYGQRYFRSSIQSYHYFLHAYKYVYRNPTEAGLCEKVEEYRFSTLYSKLKFTDFHLPLEYDSLIYDEPSNSTLKWLNTKPLSNNWETISSAMYRPIFKISNTRHKNKKSELEYIRL